MDKKFTHALLPGLAILMSLLALAGNTDLSNALGFVVSLIGLVGGLAYFLKKKFAAMLLKIWIYAQIPAIYGTTTQLREDGSVRMVEQHYLNAGQTFTFKVGLTKGTKTGDINLKINVVPFVLLILYRMLMLQGLAGAAVTIKKFGQHNKLGAAFPFSGTVLRTVTLGKEKDWLLVELASPLAYAGRSYSHVLLKPKEDSTYKRGGSAAVSYLVVVDDVGKVHGGVNRKEDFLFVDWGMVFIT